MAQLVNTPWGELEFPDDMSQEQMQSAIKNTKEFQTQATQQPVAQEQSPAPQSFLSEAERNAVTSAGDEAPPIEMEKGSTGVLGLGKYFAREVPASLMDMGSAVQRAFGYNDLDNLRVQQQADDFIQSRKKQGIATSYEDLDKFYAGYKNTQQETAQSIRSALPVDESVKQSFSGQATKLVADTAAMVGANIATRGAASLPVNAGFLAKWGYDDAKNSGATEQAARQAAYAYTPLALAPQMALTESLAAKFIKPLAPYVGKGLTFGQAKNEILKSMGRGAVQGSVVMGLQQTELNTLMKMMDIAPDRPLTQDVMHTMAMGAVMGGTIAGAGTTFNAGATMATPENKAFTLASRVTEQAKQTNLNTDALRKAAGVPDGSSVEKMSTKYAQNNDGQNSTEITYITPEGKRITLKVTGDSAPSLTANPLLLEAPKPQTNTGQGESVPVGTQTIQRMNRDTRQIESSESPVNGPVLYTPPPLNSGDNVRLDLSSPVGGKKTFIEGEVLPDKSGVRIGYIPDELAGDIAQLEATTTAIGQPSKMPKVGDVVPMSVAERNFKLYGYRADSAWYSNMAEPRKTSPKTEPTQAQQTAEPSVTQAQSNNATLAAAKRTGLPQEQLVEQIAAPYFPTAPERSQAGAPTVEQKKEPAFPRRKQEVGRKKAEKDGRPYFPSAPDRMQYSERGVPTQEQKSYASRMGQALLTALRKIAPKGAAELEIFLGPKPEGYSDNAVAAYDPRRAMIWLSDRIATFKQQVGEFTHEAGHVFWDTLPDNVKRSFAELYSAEMRTKTGPLFNSNGNIKDGISPRIASGSETETSVAPWDTVGLREWFAERIMVENSDWAMGKATTEGIIGRTAGVFRSVLQRISGALGQGDAMNNAFKSWAELGPRYGIKPELGEPARPNVATRLVPRRTVQESTRPNQSEEYERIEEAADSQRGRPESVMMDVTMKLKEETASSPVLIDLLEHIGDLSNRAQKQNAIGNVDEKLYKVEKYEKNNWGTLRQAIESGYRENAEYRVLKTIPELNDLRGKVGQPNGPRALFEVYERLRNEHGDKIKAEIRRSKKIAMEELQKYVEAHERYNKPVTRLGVLGKDAAIALGKQDLPRLESIVSEMRKWVDEYNVSSPEKRSEMFVESAQESTRGKEEVKSEIPRSPINEASKIAVAMRNESGSKFQEAFFEEFWPKLLMRIGQKGLKMDKAGIEMAAKQAVADLGAFVASNPDYARYYSADIRVNENLLAKAFPEVKENPELTTMFKMMASVLSPDTSLGDNMHELVTAFSLLIKDGNFDAIKLGKSPKSGGPVVLESPFTFLGKTGGTKATSIKVLEKLAKENGYDGTAKLMQTTLTLTELNKWKRGLGYSGGVDGPAIKQVVMEATGQDINIPRAFTFGPKVGAYMMNWLGDSRFTVTDVWESRIARSYWPQLFRKVIDKDGNLNTGIATGSERAMFQKWATAFNRNFEESTGIKLGESALQALRWFYIIDATGKSGYKGAVSNEPSSEYTRQALVEAGRLNESDKESWRQGADGSLKPILLEQFTGEVAYRGGSSEGRAGSLSDAQRLYDVRELTPEEFVQTASKNKSEAKFGTSVDVLSPDQYKDYDLVQASWGGETATISVAKNGEIGSVTRSQNAMPTLVRVAMDAALHMREGRSLWLNGFDTILPKLYWDFGFEPVAKLKFNDEYRPDGWDYKAYSKFNNGRPDVMFMRYTGKFTANYRTARAETPYVESYEKASEMASGKPQMSERGQQEFRNNLDDDAYTKTLGMHSAEVQEMAGAVSNLVNSAYEGRVDAAALRVSTSKLRRLIVDRFADFKDFKKMVEKRGALIPENSDFHTMEQNMHGIIGAKLEALYDAHETIVGSLKELGLNQTMDAMVGGKSLSMGMIDLYMYARHAPERNARIFTLSEGKNTLGSGMTDSEAVTILAKLAPFEAKLSTVARMVYDLNRTKLRMMEAAGLISAEARQAIEVRYPNYCPLIGKAGATEEEQFSQDTGIGAGMTMLGRDIKEAKGRYSASANILANAFQLQQRAVVRSERNITLKSLAKLAGEFTDNGLVEKVAEFRTNENTLTPEIITYKENGQNKYLRLLDDDLIKSFKQSRGQLDQIFSFMGKGTRFMASMATTYNPAFAVPNLVRDFQTAIFNMNSTEIAGLEKDFALKMFATMKAVWEAESQAYRSGNWNKNVSPQVAEAMKYYKEFRASGGQMIFMGLRDAEYYQKKMDALLLRKEGVQQAVGKTIDKLILGPYKEVLEHINSSLENATRLSAYMVARERGLSPQKAANLSRNLTVNFTQRGQLTALNQIYMFFNASLAGSARMVETISTSPRGRAMAASIVMAGFTQRLASRYLSDEDENGIKEVDKVPAYQLSTNMVQALPSVPTWIKLPLAYGANVFWYLGVQMADMLPREYGGMSKSPLKATGEFVKAAMNAFNPIGGGAELVNSLTPSVIQPLVDISINRNFAGQPIYPTDNPFDASPDPYAFRTWSNPNPVIASVVQSIAKYTGGNEIRPSLAENTLSTFGMGSFASPESVEYLFKSVFSGPYSIYSDASKTVSGLQYGQGISPNNLPIVRRFIGGASDRSDSVLFKEAWQNIATARDELKLYMKNGDRASADRVRREYPAELACYDQFSRINYQLKNLRTQAKSYKSKGNTEGEVRVQKMIRDTQVQALGQYKRSVDSMGSSAGDNASDQVKSLFY